ncbi:MAG TPA: hypothetical protein VJR29_04950 [bacterium]|nr:hypothetical protein [bacterium]
MSPPPFTRVFGLGFSHPRVGEADLRPPQGRLDGLLRAAEEQRGAAERQRTEAADQFLVAPTLRYRPLTSDIFRQFDSGQMEARVPALLAEARAGNRIRYFNLLQLHYGLLERAAPADIPALSQRVSEIAMEYAEFLRNRSDIPDREKMMQVYAGARMLHTYLAYLLSPPRPLEFPERPATLNLLFSTLDTLDIELQRLHVALRSAGQPDIAEYEGVARLIELRRRLRTGSPEDRRQAALALAEELTLHPPPEAPAENDWQSRAERAFLDTPQAVLRLRSFDRPSAAEERAAALNGLALETLEVAAATLDRANEESEAAVLSRYRDLGLVLSVSILRHPDSTLEEILDRLQNAAHQADFIEEISQAAANPALAGALREALNGRDASGLAQAARQAALHVQRLREGIGSQILPILLEENRQQHPLRRTAEALSRLPALAVALGLPQAGAVDPMVQRAQAVELLRRGHRGLAEIDAFHRDHPEASLGPLRQSLSGGGEPDGFAGESLNRLALVLNRGRDHEIAALHAVFIALDRGEEIGAGLRLSEASRHRARALVQQIESAGFRAGRVLSHLSSRTSLLGLLAGVLATEFLPTLLIARAGVSGSLALGRIPLVTRGALALPGSALTGLGTGIGMSLVGSSLHQWERSRDGLSTHFGRDFGTSLAVNALAFSLTLPLSSLWNRALTPRFDATTPLTPLSAGRRFLLHGGNVAIGGLTTFGLGYVGRGIGAGQWRTSAEEVAENFGSILMWEAGTAGLRALRRRRGHSGELGAYRQAEVERLTGRILEMNGGLGNRRTAVQNHLAREELRYPGWLGRFGGLLEGGGHVPILEGSGRHERLLLVPENSLPPPPAPEPAPPTVIFMRTASERPALPSAGSAANESFPPPPVEAEASSARPRSLPPLALDPTPHYFAVEADANFGENGGTLNLTAIPEGQVTWVIGRDHFPFLSAQARRVVSRSHLEIRRDESGRLWVRDLSAIGRQHLWPLGWQNKHGTFYAAPAGPPPNGPANRRWLRVPSDQFLALENIEALGLGDFENPVVLGLRPTPAPAVLETLPIDASIPPALTELPVSLAVGQRRQLNGLLLIRSTSGSTFHLGGSGNSELQITRSVGDRAGQMESTHASMNPIVGEIGETTRVIVTENGRSQEYRLSFDDPELPAAHLPQIGLEFHGNRGNFRFRATEAELAFGKNSQPELFQAQWISRRHFSLRVVSHLGQPRYLLTADSRFGLMIGSRLLRPTESALLYAGDWELGFCMNGTSTAVDGPLRLSLPPIDSVFPEWRTQPLAAGHDRGIPPPPPPPPPLPPRQAPPPPAAPNWIQRLWRQYFG